MNFKAFNILGKYYEKKPEDKQIDLEHSNQNMRCKKNVVVKKIKNPRVFKK